ncbi:MAG: type II toxin-antitoxin system ParD family antitoxin [Pseudomonadota bacterium]
MPKNTSVTLNDHFETFIDQEIASGRYTNRSEVVRAGLRLLQDESDKLKALRAALRKGLDSGPSKSVDEAEFLARMNTKHAR